MNAANKVVFLLSAGLLPLVAAAASASEEDYLKSCRKDPGVPVPIVVVSPRVSPEYEGTSVHLEFVVDAKGRPSAFAIKAAADDILATEVVNAVKQWRFQPAEVDGKAVAMKVALPVRIVPSGELGPRLAARD